MRSLLTVAASFFIAVVAFGTPAAAAETATGSVTVTAQFGSRTSLKVSTQVLQFDVARPGDPATAVVEFSAGARTRDGGEVVLSVEPMRAIDGPGGAADVDAALTFAGDGAGTLSGALDAAATSVAGRWSGSGLRSGRLVFALRASAPGTYTVPVRFVLTTP
jgi:hypothetical protein